MAIKITLTWLGMSRLLFGRRTQFLHILLTRSSLIMTISWLQYWILTRLQQTLEISVPVQSMERWPVHAATVTHLFYLHGLVVNTENGTLCLNSSVMWSAKGGLTEIHLSTFSQSAEKSDHSDFKESVVSGVLPRQDGAWTRVLGTRNEHKATTTGLR